MTTLLLKLRAWWQGGSNLDTMRSTSPALPNSYQPTGSLPAAGYDDPKPGNTSNYDSYLTRLAERGNATGVAGGLPMQAADPTAGSASVGGWSYNLDSGNYNFTLPALSLPGRAGLNLSLALSYNSKVWTRDDSTGTMVFNGDRGFPAPGWRLGFGSILVKNPPAQSLYLSGTTGAASILYVVPDGTRREMAQVPGTYNFKTYDSSYLTFDALAQVMYFPDGTRVKYGAYSYDANVRDYQALPVEVKDRNGNYLTIAYKDLTTSAGTKKAIDYCVDTAGRRVDFNYQNNLLTSISQNRDGVTFYYLRLDYLPVAIQGRFVTPLATDPSNIIGAQVYFPVKVTYPTGVNYRFNYTSYGQINVIQKWAPAVTGQGGERAVASTTLSLAHCVDLNAPPNSPDYCAPLGDVARFGVRSEWAENWQGGQPQIYQYSYGASYGHEVFDPTGRQFRVLTDGLTQSLAILAAGSSDWTKKDEVTYTSDAGVGYLSNLRVTESRKTALTGGIPQIKTTQFSYTQRDGMWLPSVRDEYNVNSVYRRTVTEYTSYPAQYILGLPQQVSVYAGAGSTLLTRVSNNYDETSNFNDSNGQVAPYFIDATGDGAIQHDDTNYGGGFTSRGNLTSIVQYSVVGGAVTGSRVTKRVSYDTNGNVCAEADAAGNRRQVEYADNYANKPSNIGPTCVYPYTTADPTGFRRGARWDYFTGQTVSSFNLPPGDSTERQVVTTSYDFAGRPSQTTRPDGGWVKTAYWDNWLAVATSQQMDAGQVHYKFELSDGVGRTIKKASDHPDGVSDKYSGQITVFDKVGQVEDSSNVLAVDGGWTPTAEDQGKSFLYTHLTRDELSRLKLVTLPDNNTRQYDYTGCGCAGNSETRVSDELGHSTVTKTDALSRLVEAVEPDATNAQNTYSKARYVYDALDRLVEIQHEGAYNNQTGYTPTQHRYFSYDGYGRLASETTPEGGTVTYTYTANDQVATRGDQRNVTAAYVYNSRNLLANMSYSDGTPTVVYSYDSYGARILATDGEGQTSYSYNSYRQLQSETRTFTDAAVSGNNYKLSYSYNLADQVRQVSYGVYYVPGLHQPPVYLFNKNVNYAYNAVGALSSVGTDLISGANGSNTTNVLNTVTFRASGALSSLQYGNGRRLTMGYNDQRSQPISMVVDRANNSADRVIDYSYEYYTTDPQTGASVNNNRIRKITDNVDGAYTTTYSYDAYNRLASATSSADSKYYQYDAWGNIRSVNQTLTYSYAAAADGAPATNRLEGVALNGVTQTAYGYDAAGNTTSGDGKTFAFDAASRLKSVNNGASTYGYDGDGMRVKKTENGATSYYIYSSKLKQSVMEVNINGVLRAYVYGGGKLLAMQGTDGQFYWFHGNHLGNSRAMTDASGDLTYKGQFDPYGQSLSEWSASGNNNLNAKKFTGDERDSATGLDYAMARMYKSARGRFMSPDPIGLKSADVKRPFSLNRYIYVESDPVNYVDPEGKMLAAPDGNGGGFCGGYSLFGWGYPTDTGFIFYGFFPGSTLCLPDYSGGGGNTGGDPVAPESRFTFLRAKTIAASSTNPTVFQGGLATITLLPEFCEKGSTFNITVDFNAINIKEFYYPDRGRIPHSSVSIPREGSLIILESGFTLTPGAGEIEQGKITIRIKVGDAIRDDNSPTIFMSLAGERGDNRRTDIELQANIRLKCQK